MGEWQTRAETFCRNANACYAPRMIASRAKITQFLGQILPSLAVLTLAIFSAYAMTQQSLRMSANDPQIQLAEDVSAALGSGKNPTDFFGDLATVNLDKSLATFVVIYDAQGRALASNASLFGSMPKLPKGVLDAAKIGGQNRVTWQPKPGLRFATVVVSYVQPGGDAGFVVAGRSLREVEKRYANLAWISFATWAAGAAFLLLFFGWLYPLYIAMRLSNKL